MKALSLKQAARCETAKHPHCKCRCHGALHGVFRDAALKNAEATVPELLAFFEALPADDPHHIDDAEAKKRKRKQRRKAAKTGQEQPAVDTRQLPLIPPGLAQEMLGCCAVCGQDEWVHRAYWAAGFGAAGHEFQPKEASCGI